jgi:hypothetical protein
MQLTSGDIIGLVQDALKWTAADVPRIYGPLNMAYWDICELTDWPLLRKVKAAVFSGTALPMPEDTIGVTNIIGAGNDPFWQIDEADVESTSGRKRWYYAGKTGTTALTAFPSVQIVDATGTALSESVAVHYWVYPPRIAATTDSILVPTSRALVIKTVQYVMSTIDHDNDAADRLAQEYDKAVAEMLAKANKPNRYGGGRR